MTWAAIPASATPLGWAVSDNRPNARQPADLAGWYAELQARIGVVIARLLDLDDSRASRPKTADNSGSADNVEKCYYRVRDVMRLIGLSKPKVFQALKDRKLDGLKLDGVLLITTESVERYLHTATPWKPKR